MKKVAILLFVMLLLSSMPLFAEENAVAALPQPMPQAKWTIMIYIDRDNDLESMVIKDFNELEMVGSTDDMRIVVEIDRWDGFCYNKYERTGDDDTSNGNWTDTRRYYVTKDSDPEIIHSQIWAYLGEKNMGDPQTLQDFIDWSKYYFPADHYLLILEDHGHVLPPAEENIWNTGVCWDWTSNQTRQERLSPSELKTIDFDGSGTKFLFTPLGL